LVKLLKRYSEYRERRLSSEGGEGEGMGKGSFDCF